MELKRIAISCLLAGAMLLAAGCATTRPPAIARTGDPVVDGKAYIEKGPAKDKVLWQYRTAAAAMRRGMHDEAEVLLDDALLSIGGIITDDKSAKRARSLFTEEAKKKFIGEPYERVMAYYYRGILYWMAGEPDNARACFRSAQIMDADAENKQYASDYVLLDYLDGLATAKLGGDGSDAKTRAQAISKFDLPSYDPQANVLIFLEFGNGPIKYATGEFREQLRFRPGQSLARSAVIKVGGQTVNAWPYDDLHYQATTRGGRVMDYILANKAVFKGATDTVGNAALISGLVLAHNRDTREAALGLALFGLASKAVAASTTPAADTRTWDNLPQFLSFAALRLPPGQHPATVEFLDASGRLILTRQITIDAAASPNETVVFVSEKKVN